MKFYPENMQIAYGTCKASVDWRGIHRPEWNLRSSPQVVLQGFNFYIDKRNNDKSLQRLSKDWTPEAFLM